MATEWSLAIAIDGDNEYGKVIDFFSALRKKGFKLATDEDGDVDIRRDKPFTTELIDDLVAEHEVDCDYDDVNIDETQAEKVARLEANIEKAASGDDEEEEDEDDEDDEDDD